MGQMVDLVRPINSNGLVVALILTLVFASVLVLLMVMKIETSQGRSTLLPFSAESDEYLEKKEGKLGETISISGLDFKLEEVRISEAPSSYPFSNVSSHVVNLQIRVANKGESIEKIDYFCGALLFEDGAQYTFDAEKGNIAIKDNGFDYYLKYHCYNLNLVPGATAIIADKFYFSDKIYNDYISFAAMTNDDEYRLFHDKAIAWEDVPGSKIKYLMEQKNQVIEIEFDKGNVIEGNPAVNFTQWQGYFLWA